MIKHVKAQVNTVKASNYLHWLKKYRRKYPNSIAVLYNRESSYPQDYKRNHETHEKVLRRVCKKYGINVVRFYCETCSGKMWNADRQELRRAVRKALMKIKKGKHAFILATSSDRYLRNIDFHTIDNPAVLPTEVEFEKLKKLTRGVPLVTLLNPDRSWRSVRGYQSKWGQRVKGNKGGHPVSKRPRWTIKRREEKLPAVNRLVKKGWNPTDIARKVKLPRQTVSDWIDKYI
ncbi:MAG: helix-turn-helix domain-containing protein [Planctomycetota bacterium]|jgi:hypothetical protein